MDDYSRQCIKWLVENDKELLAQYVNTICGSSTIPTNVDEVEQMILGAGKKKKEESGIKCKSCGKDTVTFFEAQTRSADEGASVFYSCTNCSMRWKQR